MTLEEFKADHDWRSAFLIAFDGKGFVVPISDVVEIVAFDVRYGDYAETDCLAVVRFADGRYAKVWASCDTIGWDCQAGGNVEFHTTAEEATSSLTLTPEEQNRLYSHLARRLIVDPAWLAWNGGTVAEMARQIAADERYDNLPILADALADAGADEKVCGHFRTRDRWALKSLLEQAGAG